ncbi:MAG: tRNA threonylcarbamoyladenosine biosynthesis protein RimN [SAR86 cluster bacterium]|uniref:Threonylcarbamoyl-AMP synthase n=1 Tax=SAR86 cluster bacterium TaxID=2030880 RepID=A0A2A5CJ46_9GAMM|nr:L-threonylcarbamoyladenylate synthase [Gammaproteobacteria bacterium AH-315-E17]PCJ43535.1 MAG: tRNA threonylcarbamoyladenosine biosynthesis protein RimN [SAR86 cluster bacterium]
MTNAFDLTAAAAHIKKGGIVAYPTEGVWGLGCDPFNKESVQKILDLKGREVGKGLVLVAADLAQIKSLVQPLSQSARDLLEASCPGPDTWLIPDTDQVIPSWIKGNFATVAIRISKLSLVKSLCERVGLLVSTSANPSGRDPALSQEQVELYFEDENIFIVPGELGGQLKPSRIRDLLSQKVLRH